MNTTEKTAEIDRFISLSNSFDDTLKLNHSILSYRPFDNAWTITEQVVHCVDFDVANFHRYRWSIAQPGITVLSFDGTWTNLLNYKSTDLPEAISVIKSIRNLMGHHLKTIAESDWSKYYYLFNPELSFNLEEALIHFNNHVGFHRELIDRNIKLYSENNS